METGSIKKKNYAVPEPALRRMPCYLAYLKLEHRKGSQYVSSTLIARDNGVDPTQVTKDLSYTGITGKTRVGYEVEPLIDALEDFLGFREMDEAYLFGAGSLGTALLHDHGLVQYGLKISTAFDVDPNVTGKEIGGVHIHHIDEFIQRKDHGVRIGILTVPAQNAQEAAQMMVENGIQAIWNFTPVRIAVPEHIVVQNTSLYAHLAVMFNRLNSSPE
ncbi:redox-sensing transcriptional repressor Rex [Alkalitalea saponilacus]|uniref:Redox-sensing transcriptional repressor Rex n=1 Tax=Alkalitalea saponilacus TaxID=889453 RepID=A0A1T5BJM7_9BACT|nr:redox-sensing transcriptional repressor Rex [Alkalitalea saponilacus]ASB49668.1 redox-sensing transcriptional repressor Rex [Alkalitalea saponilacus]SKB47365.1 redox-sensing transcriptional repressor [Alkalitalea saponilacus]